MNLPRIDALDLRDPADVIEPEMTWNFPLFPWRVQHFIETGKRPKPVWQLHSVKVQPLDERGNLLGEQVAPSSVGIRAQVGY